MPSHTKQRPVVTKQQGTRKTRAKNDTGLPKQHIRERRGQELDLASVRLNPSHQGGTRKNLLLNSG